MKRVAKTKVCINLPAKTIIWLVHHKFFRNVHLKLTALLHWSMAMTNSAHSGHSVLLMNLFIITFLYIIHFFRYLTTRHHEHGQQKKLQWSGISNITKLVNSFTTTVTVMSYITLQQKCHIEILDILKTITKPISSRPVVLKTLNQPSLKRIYNRLYNWPG